MARIMLIETPDGAQLVNMRHVSRIFTRWPGGKAEIEFSNGLVILTMHTFDEINRILWGSDYGDTAHENG